MASEALDNVELVNDSIKQIAQEREKLSENFKKYPFIEKIYKSEANFILIKVSEPKKLYNHFLQNQIIVRDRSKAPLCEGCLRITVGTQEENKKLINALNQFK